MKKVFYIVNPTSSGGTGIKVWNRYKRTCAREIAPQDVHFTRHTGDAAQHAKTVAGYSMIVAVGGDGTVGEVISGIMARTVEAGDCRPTLAVLPAGTGNDIARHISAFPLDKAISTLRDGRVTSFDLIRIECQGEAGPLYRHAFLYGTAGFCALLKFKPWMKRYLGATVGTYLSMILALLEFRPPEMTITWQGGGYTGPLWMAIAANAEKVAGASIRLAPEARTGDGVLDMLLIPAKSKPAMLGGLLPKIPTGRHIGVTGVQYFRSTALTVDAERPVLVEIDGDVFGYTPAVFAVCPKALGILSG